MGRLLLKGILATHADRLAVAFLCSRLSRPLIGPYARRNGIQLTETQKKDFRTYRDLFLRTRTPADFDTEPSHLISPCDGWLSAYPIREDSSPGGGRYCESPGKSAHAPGPGKGLL